MAKGVTYKMRKVIRRGYWVTILQSVLYLGLLFYIIFAEFSLMEDFMDFSLPIINQLPRW